MQARLGSCIGCRKVPMALDPSAVGFTSAPSHFTYDWKTVVLYALGIGAKRDELDYLYEGQGSAGVPDVRRLPGHARGHRVPGEDGRRLRDGGARRTKRATSSTDSPERRARHDRDAARDVRHEEVRSSSWPTRRPRLRDGEPLFETTWSIIYRGRRRLRWSAPAEERRHRPAEGSPGRFPRRAPDEPRASAPLSPLGRPQPASRRPRVRRRRRLRRGTHLARPLQLRLRRARHHSAAPAEATRASSRRLDAQFRRPVWPGDTIVVDGWTLEPDTIAAAVTVKERPDPVVTGVVAARLKIAECV